MKKFLFVLTCFVSLFLFTPNILAANYLPDSQIVNFVTYNGEDIVNELYRGDDVQLDNYLSGNNMTSLFNSYYSKLKQYVATQRGYSSWDNLINDYYYVVYFHLYNLNNDPQLQTNFYFLPKTSSENLTYFTPVLSATSRTVSTITANTEIMVSYGMRYWQGSTYGFLKDVLTIDDSNITSHTTAAVPANFYCRNGSSSCGATYSDNIMSVNIYQYFTGGHLFYFDTNNPQIDIKFNQHDYFYSSFGYYWYNKAKINNGSYTYSREDTIGYFDVVLKPNIQDYGNNSYGFNSNYTLIKPFPISSDSIICPNTRSFDNDICYLYNTDILNYDSSDTTLHHFVRYYLGDNTNIPLRNNYYYIFTFRIYSQYSIPISQLRVHSGSTNNPTTISDVKITDYNTYKDYQIIFTPNISGNLAVNYIDIFFNDFTSLTNSLPENYSFGVYKSFKYSEFSSSPSSSDITNDYNTNNINAINQSSNSNFFTKFNINDRGLSQIVLSPLNFIRSLSSSTCSSIILPIQHLNSNIILPCLDTVFTQKVPTVWTLYKILFNGFVIYRICISLFHILKNFYNVDKNEIEVIDL